MESVKIWKALIQTNRNDAEMWRGLSKALYAAGDTNTAEKCSIKANEIEGLNQSPTTNIEPGQQLERTATEMVPQSNDIPPVQSSPSPVSEQEMSEANSVLSRPIEPTTPVVQEVTRVIPPDAGLRLEVDHTRHTRASPSVAPLRFSRFGQKTASVSLFSVVPRRPRALTSR